MASNMNSDAEYVESVMMSQSLIKPVVSSTKEGDSEGPSRKRALSGDVEGESSQKMKQAEGTCISDLVDLMKAQFTSFRADFQDM